MNAAKLKPGNVVVFSHGRHLWSNKKDEEGFFPVAGHCKNGSFGFVVSVVDVASGEFLCVCQGALGITYLEQKDVVW